MSSRITIGLAVLFLFGAVVAGYWGLVLSRAPDPAPQAPVVQAPTPAVPVTTQIEDITRKPVLILAKDIPPYVAITAEDLIVENMKVAPAGSFTKLEEAVGRKSWRTLPAGTWLSEESFEAGGTLARMIRPGERAIALAVDEVIGAGGQLSPGDYVDVLLFLPQDQNSTDRSAQTVAASLRVLTVGDVVGPVMDGQSEPGVTPDERAKQQALKKNARSVVVAVPERLLTPLMLASQAGPLRLAVRSAEEKNLERYVAGDDDVAKPFDAATRNVFRITQLGGGSGATTRVATTSAPAAPRAAKTVEIIRGNQITQQTP